MVDAGRAVFTAVGKFSGLTRPAKDAEEALRGTEEAAKDVGQGIPKDGGQTSRGLQSIADRAGRLGEDMQRTGGKMTLGLTAPIALFGKQAISSFAEFETALTQAGIKSGATEKQIARMKDTVMEAVSGTRFTATEGAQGIDMLAAAGFNAEDSMKALGGVLDAATASNEDLALTAEVVGQSMNAFDINAEHSTKVADMLAVAANTTALDMEDIGNGMSHAGQLGAQFGQDMSGVLAAMGRLVDLGVPASSAGTALRQMMQSLAAPTKKQKGFLEDLNVELRDSEGNMLQLPKLLANMEDGLSDTNPEFAEAAKAAGVSKNEYRDMAIKGMLPTVEAQKALAISMADGKEVLIDVNDESEKMDKLKRGLQETMGDEADEWINARTEMGEFRAEGADTVTALDALNRESEGAGKAASEAFSGTLEGRLKNFRGAIGKIGRDLAGMNKGPLIDVVDFMTDLLNVIHKIVKTPGVGHLVAGALAAAAVLGPLLVVAGTLLRTFRRIAKVGGTLSRLRPGRRKVAPGPSTTGGGAPDGGKGGMSVWWNRPMPVYLVGGPAGGGKGKKGGKTAGGAKAGTRSSTVPFVGWGLNEGKGKGRRGKSGAAGGGRSRKRSMGRGAAAAGGAAALGGGMAALFGGDLGDMAKSAGIFAAIEVAIMAVTKIVGAAGPIFGKLIGFIARLGPLFLRVVPFVIRFLGPIGLAISAAIMIIQHWDKVKSFLSWVWSGIVAGAVWAWGLIRTYVGGALSAVWGVVKAIGSAIWGYWTMMWNALKATVQFVWGMIGGVVKAGANIVWQIIRLVFALIMRYWHTVWQVVKAVVWAAWKFITNVVIPTARLIWAMIKMFFGLVLAFWRTVWDAVLAVVKSIWDKIEGAISKAVDVIKGVIRAVLDWIEDRWGAKWDRVRTKATDVFDGLKSTIGGAVDWIKEKLRGLLDVVDTVRGTLGKLSDGMNWVGDKIGGAADWVMPDQKDPDKKRGGGLVGGSGRGDKYPHLLEAGEFVVRRAAVRKPGVLAGLQRLNQSGAMGMAADRYPDPSGLSTTASSGSRNASEALSAMMAGTVDRDRTRHQLRVTPAGGAEPRTLQKQGAGADRDLSVTVNNPKPERAGRSVSKVLRSTAEEEGWT